MQYIIIFINIIKPFLKVILGTIAQVCIGHLKQKVLFVLAEVINGHTKNLIRRI